MTLRTKLLWAQAPLVSAMLVAVGLTVYAAREFGAAPGAILHENFRSFDAGLSMLRAVEVIEREGESPESTAIFERALELQQGNITEDTEAEHTETLTTAWKARDRPTLRRTLDAILRLNRDAMQQKAHRAARQARHLGYALTAAVLAALVLALLATAIALRRVLAPLRVLTQSARRLAQGDLEVRVRLSGQDEATTLADAFNELGAAVSEYRRSSLGELLEANNRLQAVMDSLADALLVYGADGDVLSRNAVAQEHFDPLPDALNDAIQEALDAVARTGEPVVSDAIEAAVEVPDHPSPRFVLVNATPVRGAAASITVALRDVTHLRKLEGFRGDLVAAAAHELRTPLTSMQMSVHMCLEGTAGTLTATQQDLLAAAREDCERLQAVVDELLELARLEAGSVNLDREIVPVVDLLARAAELHEAQARREGREIIVDSGDRLAKVHVDLDRIRHVFDNLIDNALKHAHGLIRLSHDREGAWVLVHIDDAGPGIPESLRERVFEKFYRMPGTARSGTGLGLGLVRDLVRAHGGRVTVTTSPQQGTRFTLWLPSV